MADRPKRVKSSDIVTRECTIHMSKRLYGVTFKNRAPRAIREVKAFATKQMNTKYVDRTLAMTPSFAAVCFKCGFLPLVDSFSHTSPPSFFSLTGMSASAPILTSSYGPVVSRMSLRGFVSGCPGNVTMTRMPRKSSTHLSHTYLLPGMGIPRAWKRPLLMLNYGSL